MSFDTLGLSDKVVAAVKAVGYVTPTPIQVEAIPHVLARRDVLGLAQTGTGKTASFVLPMLTVLEQGRARARMPRTLILEPTRELAAQVQENFDRYGANHRLNVALLIGGVSFDEQDKKITRGADVLIATPGRLLDHFERGRLLLTGVEILVIDEADRMLDMGFIPDIERIVKLLPFTRQTLFFSATMPPEITSLVEKFLHTPVRVEVSKPASTADNIAQSLVKSGDRPDEKRATLRALIDAAPELTNAIIFCNRKRDVATLFRSLERHGYSAGALHGDMDQHARLATLDSFRDNRITLLVASDVAARGLDIPAVSHVFNFDVPTHPEDYVHRIGRTGRAGRPGQALTIVTDGETKYIGFIEKLIGRTVDWADAPAGVAVSPSDSGEREGGVLRGERSSGRRGERSGRGRRGESARGSERPGERAGERTSGRGGEREGGRPVRRSRGNGGDVRVADTTEVAAAEEQPAAPREDSTKHEDAVPSYGRERGRGRSSAGDPVRAGASSGGSSSSGSSSGGRGERRGAEHRGGGRSRGDEPAERAGFSDHVPAFLLRPVRPAPQAQPASEVAEDA